MIITVPAAPILGQVERISATQIRISWEPNPQDSTGGLITNYIVKYYPLSRVTHFKQSIEDSIQFLTSNETDVVIQDLDPGLSYSVSVAANNAAGRGSYSDEITVGCKWLNISIIIYIHVCQESIYTHCSI